MDINAFQRNDYMLGGTALLLIIDLLFLPWFSFSFGPIHLSTTATGSLDGWTAVIAVLALVAVIVDVALERLQPGLTVPSIGSGRGQTRLVLVLVAVGFVVLKFLLHIHFSDFGFAFYAAIVLCVALVLIARAATNTTAYTPEVR